MAQRLSNFDNGLLFRHSRQPSLRIDAQETAAPGDDNGIVNTLGELNLVGIFAQRLILRHRFANEPHVPSIAFRHVRALALADDAIVGAERNSIVVVVVVVAVVVVASRIFLQLAGNSSRSHCAAARLTTTTTGGASALGGPLLGIAL